MSFIMLTFDKFSIAVQIVPCVLNFTQVGKRYSAYLCLMICLLKVYFPGMLLLSANNIRITADPNTEYYNINMTFVDSVVL